MPREMKMEFKMFRLDLTALEPIVSRPKNNNLKATESNQTQNVSRYTSVYTESNALYCFMTICQLTMFDLATEQFCINFTFWEFTNFSF